MKIRCVVGACALFVSTHLSILYGDFRDDIGYTQLKTQFGTSLPDGSQITMVQVEADWSENTYAPEAVGELSGKTFTYASPPNGYSPHAFEVARYLGGSATSIVPTLSGWSVYPMVNYDVGIVKVDNSLDPPMSPFEIENLSFVEQGGTFPVEANLRKQDFRIERDDVIVVAGLDNHSYNNLSYFWANFYNGISVGLSSGDHARNGSSKDGTGRVKPEIVAPMNFTSYATPIVTSCAILLKSEAKRNPQLSAAANHLVVKALLLAGATKDPLPSWSNSPEQPLDWVYGAGQVNIYNSYMMLLAGQKNVGTVAGAGWNFGTSRVAPDIYYFQKNEQEPFSAVLTWDRHVTAGSDPFPWYTPTSTLANLDMALWSCDSAGNLVQKLTESRSINNNIEHIYQPYFSPGYYALVVSSDAPNERYAIAWRGGVSPPATSLTLTNAGFETPPLGVGSFAIHPGSAGWSFSGSAGISANGSGFTSGNPAAPEGAQVAILQQNGSIFQTINSPAGRFSIGFSAAQRANWQTSSQDFEVKIDGQPIGTFRPVSIAYTTYTTNTFSLSAGSHTVSFEGLNSWGGDNTVFIDRVTISEITAPAPSIPNSGFEMPGVGANSFYAFAYAPSGASWTFIGNAGISGNGSGFTESNPNAPEGGQVAFLQMTGTITQSMTLPAGTFRIALKAAQRVNYQSSSQDFQVLVDGTPVGYFRPPSAFYTALETSSFNLAAGTHTISIQGVDSDGGDNTALIDAIELR